MAGQGKYNLCTSKIKPNQIQKIQIKAEYNCNPRSYSAQYYLYTILFKNATTNDKQVIYSIS